jgi:hypothetical protein
LRDELPLHEHLPPDKIEEFWKNSFGPFQVYGLQTRLKDRSYKYCILICLSPTYFFFINSKIHEISQYDHHLRSLQIVLPKNKHPFLKRDSYVNCGVLVDESMVVVNDLFQGKGDYLGKIEDEQIQQEIIDAVKASRLLSPIQKKYILNYLT